MIATIKKFCETHKIKQNVADELCQLITELTAKKSRELHPPRINDDGETEYYCRFHKKYYLEADMVMSNGKSKGYSKAAIAVWNKRNAAIKKLAIEVSDLVAKDDFEAAKVKNAELAKLKAELNDPATYDVEANEAAFKANKK